MSVSVGVMFAYIGTRSGCPALVAVLLVGWSRCAVGRSVGCWCACGVGLGRAGRGVPLWGGPRAYRFAALRELAPDGLRPFWCWVSELRVVAFVG